MLTLEFRTVNRRVAPTKTAILPSPVQRILHSCSTSKGLMTYAKQSLHDSAGNSEAMTSANESCALVPNNRKSPRNTEGNYSNSRITSRTVSIDHMHESLSISEAPDSSPFVNDDKTSQLNSFIASNSLAASQNNATLMTRGTSLIQSVSTDPASLSSIDLELDLLEKALSKDGGNSSVEDHDVNHVRIEKKAEPSVLEQEFFFPDLLGSSEITADVHQAMKNSENLQGHGKRTFDAQRGRRDGRDSRDEESHTTSAVFADTDMSNALAGLVDSGVSGEFHGAEMGFHQFKGSLLSSSTITSGEVLPSYLRHAIKSAQRGQISNAIAQTRGPNMANLNRVKEGRVRKSWLSNRNATLRIGSEAEEVIGTIDENKKQLPDGNGITHSPSSDRSSKGPRVQHTHPDMYPNLPPETKKHVDKLGAKISSMPRRKLRENLAKLVTIEDVEPLMCINRDELATMLGLGVTTWKMFVHHTLCIPRWPARALKSQQVKEQKLYQKKLEAEQRGEYDLAERLQKELDRMIEAHQRRRRMLRDNAQVRVANATTRTVN